MNKHLAVAAAAWILLVGALGSTLALQGWRTETPSTDVIPYIDSAYALVLHGHIPEQGVITSLDSYAPPGLTWAVLPGIALFSDPRIVDAPGWMLLYLGTLAGVFLLARSCFGLRCAFLSVLLYGLSERGLMFAGLMGGVGVAGPRGHPIFYVWMSFWVYLWVARRDARYLAAACATWLVGMWVFMEVAPAAFMIPAVWILYRPPVRVWPLAGVAAIALVVWFPYLRFESTRRFIDIQSQLLVQDVTPATYADALCNPALTPHRLEGSVAAWSGPGDGSATLATRSLISLGGHVLGATRVLSGNFEGLLPGTELLLLPLAIAGLIAMSGYPRHVAWGAHDSGSGSRPVSWQTVLAIGLLIWAVVVNEAVVRGLLGSRVRLGHFSITSIRILQGLTVVGGLMLLARQSIGRFLGRLARQFDSESCAPQVLAVALVIPWVILSLVVEPGRENRAIGLWPLQVIVISFVALSLPAALGRSARAAGSVGVALIALLILVNPFAVSRVEAWHQQGWSGLDADEINVASFVAQRLKVEGRTRSAIGYQLFADNPPAPPWKPPVDSRMKVGQGFDLVLERIQGISNLNQCLEGISAQDEYRIVEVSPPSTGDSYYYFDVPLPGRVRLLERIGHYDVYRRE